jgi:phage protein D/phage baseplate assembly protein gpV
MSASYTAQPTLKIDGQAASASLMEDILQLSVEESLHLPGMFTLVIRNDYYPARSGEKPWQYEKTLTIGKPIEIGFTSSTTDDRQFSQAKNSTLIKGEITAIEAHFNAESQAPIVVRGYDVSHRLHRGRYNRSFQNMKDSDIVRQIVKEAGVSVGTIDDTGGPFGFGDPVGYVFQENQTNMEFLRERAARHGFELFVQDGKLHFRKPTAGASLQLKWLEAISSFQVRVSSAEQVSAVEVRGWDYQNKKPIVSTRSSQTEEVVTAIDQGKGSAASTAFQGKPTLVVVNQPIASSQESDTMAQALYNELSGEFIQADAKAEGNPEIRPGKVIKLSDLGKYSGKYYVTETRHFFQQRIYTTEFSVRGLRDNDLLTAIMPQTRLQPGQTLMIGVVTNNKDPKKWGRVRVKFPTLTDTHESDWARVISVGAGANRGFDCLPEVNDEVLVGFEHGDIHRPFVIGGVWNGTDAPPASVDDAVVDGKVRLRTLKTRTGHTLQFVEEDKGESKKGVYLTTVYGHTLQLKDTEKAIALKTKEGHQLLLDDQNQKLELKSKGGQFCKMDDQGRKMQVNGTGEIEVTAAQKIELKVGGSSIEITNTGIVLKVGGSSINISNAGIEQKMGANKINISAGAIDVSSVGMTTVKGSATTVKGDVSVAVSALSISLG